MAASDPTNVPGGVPEDAVDELYGLPIDDFTRRRDAIARELRDAGQRDAAAWVKGLRKPSAPAWIVNQLARTRARAAKEVLRAGEALRRAHERVLAGDGDADELRAAVDAEHEATEALVADAAGFLDREGRAPSQPTLDKVTETVRAAAVDDDARAGFAKGRLTRERSAAGFGPLSEVAPARRGRRSRGRTGGTAAKKPGGRKRGPKRQAHATKSATEPTKREAAAQRARERELKAAERELESARREAERAQRRLERAAADVEQARSRARGG
jgi:hypothetical protein